MYLIYDSVEEVVFSAETLGAVIQLRELLDDEDGRNLYIRSYA